MSVTYNLLPDQSIFCWNPAAIAAFVKKLTKTKETKTSSVFSEKIKKNESSNDL